MKKSAWRPSLVGITVYTITMYDNDFVLAREIEITKYFKCVVAV